jgi:H+/Na+-translocating ferredoxin:NAD+ oxidoreductase subunit G
VNYRNSVITAVILCLFAAAGTSMVAFTYDRTRDRIAANEREVLMRKLNVLIPQDDYDNRLFEDTLQVRDEKLLGTGEAVTVYRARREGKPVALVMAPVAPDGYSGTIKLLVGIGYDGTLTGVRVSAHHETPGLGDAIDEERSGWIYGFNGKSLDNPPLDRWRVKRDGGAFDQLTGATITPRAIVKAVKKTLLYYRDHRADLFAETMQSDAKADPVPGSPTSDSSDGNRQRGAAQP